MGLHDEAHLDQKFMEFAKLMNIHLNHFPKHEKYGLALEIRRAAYDVYGFIVEAQKRYQKKTTLTNLDIRHEQLRMLVRLAHTLGYFEFKDGKTLKEVVVEYPIGHARRRKDGIPLLKKKFASNLSGRFPAQQQERIAQVFEDHRKLEVMPVHEFMDLLVI